MNTNMLRGFLSVALLAGASAAGAQDLPPIIYRSDMPDIPEHANKTGRPRFDAPPGYFDRGWYGSIDAGAAVANGNFACRGPACQPGEQIHFQSQHGNGPNIGVTGGYRVWRYFAVQAHAMGFGEGDNESRYNRVMYHSQFSNLTDVHISARVDCPLSINFSLYATYGFGYKKVTFQTIEATPARLEGPDVTVDTRRAGTYRPASVGFAWYSYNTAHFGQYLGFEFSPPAGGGGFALGQWALNIGFHW